MKKSLSDVLLDQIKSLGNEDYVDFRLPDGYANQVASYTGMRADLQYLKDVCNELIKNEHHDLIIFSLWTSLLITYGKCFTDASRSKSSKLEHEDCFDTTDQGRRKIHLDLINLRHNFAAHRGVSQFEGSMAYLRINVDTHQMGIGVQYVKRTVASVEELKGILEVIEYLDGVVKLK
jgi:hypothetical protein